MNAKIFGYLICAMLLVLVSLPADCVNEITDDVLIENEVLDDHVLAQNDSGSYSKEDSESIDIQELIGTYGPTLVFHPQEQFFPDDVDEFLNSSQMSWGLVYNKRHYYKFKFKLLGSMNASAFPLNNVFEYLLANEPEARDEKNFTYFIGIPQNLKSGNISRAMAYVRVLPFDKNTTDLQFWFFYPYNGHGQAWVRVGEVYNGYFPDSTADFGLGRHYGDWEHVTLRINHSEGSPKLQSMYFAQHSGGYWYTPEQLTFEDGHPLVYVARFTHASYPNIGINSHGDHLYHREKYGNFVLGHYSGWACDLTGNGQDGGKVFETLKEGGAEIISSNVSGVDVVEPDWLRFDGAFGQYLKSRYICQIDFGPIFGKLTVFDKADVQPGMSSPVKNKAWSHGDEDKPPVS